MLSDGLWCSGMKVPKILDLMADTVLAYRPKPKSKKAERRRKRRQAAKRRQPARESSA